MLAVDTSARTITVSSTDDDQTAASVVVSVPSTLDISLFSVNQEVELQVIPQSDGTYMLAGSASDQGIQGADNQGDQQGDQGDDSGSTGSTGSTGSDTGSTGSDTGSTGASGTGSGD